MTETPELSAFNTSMREWMPSAGLPREISNSLVNAIAKVVATTERRTEGELETYGYAEYE